jgi:hypothetical protein
MKPTAISRRGQVVAGVVLLSIAVTAGATGLTINVAHGLEIRPEAGILFGLADLTRIVLPIVCGIVGWTMQTRMVAVVCVATSLFCAVTAFNGGADKHLAGKQHGADQYAIAKDAVAKLEADVTKFDAQAQAEAKNGGCGKQCRFLTERADKARVALAQAQETLKVSKPVAISENAFLTSRISSVLLLVLIESLVWMSVPAMSLLTRPAEAPKAEKPKKAPKPVTKKKTAKPKRWTPKQTQKLLNTALKKPDRRKMKTRNDNLKLPVPAND